MHQPHACVELLLFLDLKCIGPQKIATFEKNQNRHHMRFNFSGHALLPRVTTNAQDFSNLI